MEEKIYYMKDKCFWQDHFDTDCSFFIQTNATKEQVERIVALSTAIFNNDINVKESTTKEIEIFKKLHKNYDTDISSIIVRVFFEYGYTYKKLQIESIYW